MSELRTTAAAAEDLIDPLDFRAALSQYAAGITVITGMDTDAPVGFTCQSFYSVSVRPPLVSFSVMRDSTTYPHMRAGGRFAVNVLSHRQDWISNQFAHKGTDKWDGVAWTSSAAGNPVIDGCLLWLDCELHQEHEAGDHFVVIGRVRSISVNHAAADDAPLVFFRGSYRQLAHAENTSD